MHFGQELLGPFGHLAASHPGCPGCHTSLLLTPRCGRCAAVVEGHVVAVVNAAAPGADLDDLHLWSGRCDPAMSKQNLICQTTDPD